MIELKVLPVFERSATLKGSTEKEEPSWFRLNLSSPIVNGRVRTTGLGLAVTALNVTRTGPLESTVFPAYVVVPSIKTDNQSGNTIDQFVPGRKVI